MLVLDGELTRNPHPNGGLVLSRPLIERIIALIVHMDGDLRCIANELNISDIQLEEDLEAFGSPEWMLHTGKEWNPVTRKWEYVEEMAYTGKEWDTEEE